AKVHQVEARETQRLEVVFHMGTQVGGGRVNKAIGTGNRANLGGEDQFRRVRGKRLANQCIGTDRTVEALVESSSVDVVDAQFDGAAQDSAASLGVAGWTLEPIGGQTH